MKSHVLCCVCVCVCVCVCEPKCHNFLNMNEILSAKNFAWEKSSEKQLKMHILQQKFPSARLRLTPNLRVVEVEAVWLGDTKVSVSCIFFLKILPRNCVCVCVWCVCVCE